MPITSPITRSNATPEQIAAEAKARFAQLKKFESFDLESKRAKIQEHQVKIDALNEEINTYLDFLGIPADAPTPEPSQRREKGTRTRRPSMTDAELKPLIQKVLSPHPEGLPATKIAAELGQNPIRISKFFADNANDKAFTKTGEKASRRYFLA